MASYKRYFYRDARRPLVFNVNKLIYLLSAFRIDYKQHVGQACGGNRGGSACINLPFVYVVFGKFRFVNASATHIRTVLKINLYNLAVVFLSFYLGQCNSCIHCQHAVSIETGILSTC